MRDNIDNNKSIVDEELIEEITDNSYENKTVETIINDQKDKALTYEEKRQLIYNKSVNSLLLPKNISDNIIKRVINNKELWEEWYTLHNSDKNATIIVYETDDFFNPQILIGLRPKDLIQVLE
jgi:hypothetical protein